MEEEKRGRERTCSCPSSESVPQTQVVTVAMALDTEMGGGLRPGSTVHTCSTSNLSFPSQPLLGSCPSLCKAILAGELGIVDITLRRTQ